jgi:hypothetical protein
VTISALIVTVLIGCVIPIVVGLITKLDASSKLKGAFLLVLNLVQGALIAGTTTTGDAVFTKDSLILFAVGVATSLATYYGVYKPADVPTKLAPEFGIGPKTDA